jgi:hypothetical protein
MNIVDEECIEVHHRLGSLPMPVILESVGDAVLTEVIDVISSYDTEFGSTTFERPLERHIYETTFQNMLKSVLFPCMTRCNIGISNFRFMRGLLIKLLYVVPHIRVLILPPEKVPYMKMLRERIQILTGLEEFVFHFGCSSAILIQLSKHCPLLKKISVESSKYVDDTCVNHLLNLRSLISLNIAYTLITANGYAQLLSGLPKLQNICCCYPINPILRNVSVSLPSVNIFTGTVKATRTLVQKCQNIRQLSIIWIVGDLSGLGVLKHVVDLSIKHSRDTPFGFSPLITRLGPNLTRLKLFAINPINMDVIINYCKSLNKLVILYSYVEYDVQGLSPKSPHFGSVKYLRLMHNYGPFDFSTILHLYINLNVLKAKEMEQITDDVISRIIRVGGFRHLTEFAVAHCGDLSMESVVLLLNSCPNLTMIGHLKSWSGIPKEEVSAFKKFVQTHNMSLVVGI